MRAVVELSLIALVIGSAGAHSDEPPGTLTDAALDRWAKCAAETAFALANQPEPAWRSADGAILPLVFASAKVCNRRICGIPARGQTALVDPICVICRPQHVLLR